MKTSTTVLLLILLLGESAKVHRYLLAGPGRRLAQEEEEEEEEEEDDIGTDGYDEDDDDDEDEETIVPGVGGRAQLQCFSCQTTHREERCAVRQVCSPSQDACLALISHGQTETGLVVTYSGWCADTCKPTNKTILETRVIVSCCHTALCNSPPWQASEARDTLGGEVGGLPGGIGGARPGGTSGRQPGSKSRGRLDSAAGHRTGGSEGSAPTVGMALLLSLLAGLPAGS